MTSPFSTATSSSPPPAVPGGAGRWRVWLLANHDRLVDGALWLCLLAIGIMVLANDRGTGVSSFTFVLAGSLPLLWRRTRPLAMIVTIAALATMAGTLLPPDDPAENAFVFLYWTACYAVGAFDERPWTFPIPAIAGIPPLIAFATDHRLGGDDVTFIVVAIALVAIGRLLQLRRASVAHLRERIVLADRLREEEVAHRLSQQRIAVARELHDIVSHTIAAISIQANAGLHVLQKNPAAAETALHAITNASSEALGELRALVTTLREDSNQQGFPATDLAALPALLETIRAHGLTVSLDESGDRRNISPIVQCTTYRIVQEALTNTLRHSNASAVAVQLVWQDRMLVVCITDNGPELTPSQQANIDETASGGFGLIGMRERAHLLGGTLEAGPGEHGGFVVLARFPLDPERNEP